MPPFLELLIMIRTALSLVLGVVPAFAASAVEVKVHSAKAVAYTSYSTLHRHSVGRRCSLPAVPG
jgi:hypothetical protein